MKIKAPANRPKTQREIGSSTKSRATQRRGETSRGEAGRNGKKVPKKDNTKLFIGIGVGAFFLLFVIIAAASSGGSSTVRDDSSSVTEAEKKFNLPVDMRKQIYSEYIAGENKIEDQAQNQTQGSSIDARQAGANVRAEVDRLKQSLRIELREKWQKKYPEVNSSFIKRVIREGIDKNWGI